MNTNEHQSLGATRQLTIWRLLSHIKLLTCFFTGTVTGKTPIFLWCFALYFLEPFYSNKVEVGAAEIHCL